MKILSLLSNIKNLSQQYPQWISFALLMSAYSVSFMSITPHLGQFSESAAQLLIAMMTCMIAGMASYWMELPSWWRWINAGFALAIWFFNSLSLPTWIYLSMFVIFIGFYWDTIRTRVPYYPSHADVWEAVAHEIPADKNCHVLEIGSGFGGFSRELSKRYPHAQFTGLETAPIPWLVSYLRAKFEAAPCTLRRKNYLEEDFGRYDLIFAFLSPAAMLQLQLKATKELIAPAKIVSYMFSWPMTSPLTVSTIALNNDEYLYIFSNTLHTKPHERLP